MVGEGFVAEEHVPIRRFYGVFAVLLVTSLLLGLYVASRFSWKRVAWSTVGIWLLVAVGLAVPDQARDALLRRFGARPRRVKRFEHSNRPIFAC